MQKNKQFNLFKLMRLNTITCARHLKKNMAIPMP